MRLQPIQIPPATSLSDLQTRLVYAFNQIIDTLNVPENKSIDAKGTRITNVARPSASGDAINLAYLEEKVKRIPVIERKLSNLDNNSSAATSTSTYLYSTSTTLGTATATTWTTVPGCTAILPIPGTWAVDGVFVFLKGLNDTEVQGRLSIDGAAASPIVRWSSAVTVSGAETLSQHWIVTNTATSTLILEHQKVAGGTGNSYTDLTNCVLRAVLLST